MSRKTAEDTRRETEAAGPGSCPDDQFDAAMTGFRGAVLAAAERPEGFWKVQRASILSRVAGRPRRPAWTVALVWAATVTFVVIGIGIILDRPQAAPAPDLAAGYDQELLVDVERSLDQEVPEPLGAALLLAAEMERVAPVTNAR